MSKFWRFCDFLHRFKKILAINCKKAQCYAIAWLTLKWTQTQLCRLSDYGDYLLFVPYSRVLRYRSVKQVQMQAGGLHISLPSSIKSRALLRSGVQAYPFPLHITWQIVKYLVAIALESLEKKSIHWIVTPPPTLPCLLSAWLALTTPGHS